VILGDCGRLLRDKFNLHRCNVSPLEKKNPYKSIYVTNHR